MSAAKFYIGEHIVPVVNKSYFIGLGQCTKKVLVRKSKYLKLLPAFDSEIDYATKLVELEEAGKLVVVYN